MSEVGRRLARWGAAHHAEHPEAAEGGVCIPFTDTILVNGEHKQFWRCATTYSWTLANLADRLTPT